MKSKFVNKVKKTVLVLLSPYLSFLFIMIFVIGALFMCIEELWEEYTGNDGIEVISESLDGYIWPVPGYNTISSYFGYRIHPITKKVSFHDGIDIPAPQNTTVVSPSSGTVSSVYDSSTLGKSIEIESGEYRFVFHHLNFISVKEGEIIKKGEKIGGVGTTGTLSTGNHLHFTVYENDTKINPLDIVDFNSDYETTEGSDN